MSLKHDIVIAIVKLHVCLMSACSENFYFLGVVMLGSLQHPKTVLIAFFLFFVLILLFHTGFITQF